MPEYPARCCSGWVLAVQKFDAIFMLERSINGLSPEQCVAARHKDLAPLVNDLIEWMKRERAKRAQHRRRPAPPRRRQAHARLSQASGNWMTLLTLSRWS